MAEIELILGTAGSGKTDTAINFALEELKKGNGPVYFLTSSRANADSVIRSVLDRSGPLMGFTSGTFYSLAHSLFASQNYITHSQKSLILGEIAHQIKSKSFTPIIDLPGCIAILGKLISELKHSNISPKDILDLRDLPIKIRDVGELFLAYEAFCKERGLFDEQDILKKAALLIQNEETSPPPVFIVDEFYEFTNLQMELLKAISYKCQKMMMTFLYDENRTDLFSIPNTTLNKIYNSFKVKRKTQLEKVYRLLNPTISHLERNLFLKNPLFSDNLLKLIKAPNFYVELELIAREIYKLLESNPSPPSIVILSRHNGIFSSYAKEVFDQFKIPIRLNFQKPLLSSPLISSFYKLLKALISDLPLEEFIGFIKSAKYHISGREAFEIEYFLKNSIFKKGIANFKNIIEDGEKNPLSYYQRFSANIKEFLSKIIKIAIKFQYEYQKTNRNIIENLSLIYELFTDFYLQSLSLIEQENPPLRDEILSSIKEMNRIFLEFSDYAQLINPQKSFNEILDLFLKGLSDVFFEPCESDRYSVLISDIHSVRGLEFDYVFLVDLLEDSFPLRASDNPILTEDDRAYLQKNGIPIISMKQRMEEEPLLFYIAITRARKDLTLSYSYSDIKGQEIYPSIFLDVVKRSVKLDIKEVSLTHQIPKWEDTILLRDKLEFLSFKIFTEEWKEDGKIEPEKLKMMLISTPEIRIIQHIFNRFKEWIPPASLKDEQILARLKNQGTIYSASHIISYQQCPFKYFVEKIIHPMDIEQEYSFLEKGRLMHSILKDIYDDFYQLFIQSNGAMDQKIEKEIDEMINKSLIRAFNNAQIYFAEDYKMEYEKRMIFKTIKEYLLNEWASLTFAEEFIPYKFEIAFGMENKDAFSMDSVSEPLILKDGDDIVKLAGIIDRIDISSDGRKIRVIDYKSGAVIRDKDYLIGQGIQIPIYILALQKCFGFCPVAAEFVFLKSNERKGIIQEDEVKLAKTQISAISTREWDKILARAKEVIFEVVRKIRSGIISINPEDTKNCNNCSFKDLCRFEFYKALEV